MQQALRRWQGAHTEAVRVGGDWIGADRRAEHDRGMTIRCMLLAALAVLLATLVAPALRAEERDAASEESAEELAKKTQNPVADLISEVGRS